jgi:hypothetical protein
MGWKTLDDGFRGQGGAGAGRYQRAPSKWPGHRHHPHRRGPAHDPPHHLCRRQGRAAGAFRPPQGQARARRCRWPRCARRLPTALGAPVAFAADCIGLPAEDGGGRAAAGRRAAAGKHPLPCRARRRTIRTSPPRWPRWAMSMSTMPSRPRTGRMPRPRRIAHLLPACAGRLMEAELKALESALGKPDGPVVAVVGGSQGVDQDRPSAQPRAQGRASGDRRRHGQHDPCRAGRSCRPLAVRADMAETVREILARAEEAACTLHLPRLPHRAELAEGVESRVATDCPEDWMILDAGPESTARSGGDRRAAARWSGTARSAHSRPRPSTPPRPRPRAMPPR